MNQGVGRGFGGNFRKRERDFGQGDRPSFKRSRQGGDTHSSTVWLGNLAPETSEENVAEAFETCGKIKEIRLKRHPDSGNVKGFGFLEFFEPSSAENACQLQNVQILGRDVKIERSKPQQPVLNQGYNQGYNQGMVGARYNQGYNQGYNQMGGLNVGDFDNPLMFQLQQLAGGNLANIFSAIPEDGPHPQIQVSRIQEPQRPKVQGCRTVFVGNLSDSIDDATIFEVFAEVGDIKAIRWINDRKTGKFKGCGFIEFYTDESAVCAANMNGKMVLGRPMRVDFASNQPDDGKGYGGSNQRGPRGTGAKRRENEPQRTRPPGCTTIFVGNLPDNVDDETMYNIFSGCGNILGIRWLRNKQTGQFKGCGLIYFYDEQSTINAAQLNGIIVLGRPMRVDYSDKPAPQSLGSGQHFITPTSSSEFSQNVPDQFGQSQVPEQFGQSQVQQFSQSQESLGQGLGIGLNLSGLQLQLSDNQIGNQNQSYLGLSQNLTPKTVFNSGLSLSPTNNL